PGPSARGPSRWRPAGTRPRSWPATTRTSSSPTCPTTPNCSAPGCERREKERPQKGTKGTKRRQDFGVLIQSLFCALCAFLWPICLHALWPVPEESSHVFIPLGGRSGRRGLRRDLRV